MILPHYDALELVIAATITTIIILTAKLAELRQDNAIGPAKQFSFKMTKEAGRWWRQRLGGCW